MFAGHWVDWEDVSSTHFFQSPLFPVPDEDFMLKLNEAEISIPLCNASKKLGDMKIYFFRLLQPFQKTRKMWTIVKASSTKLFSDYLRINEKLIKIKNHEGTLPGLSRLQT